MRKLIVAITSILSLNLVAQTFQSAVAIDTSFPTVPNGLRLNMTIVQGRPAVASISPTTDSLVYCIATDSTGQSWTRQDILFTSPMSTSFASIEVIDNKPAIAYVGQGTDRLNYIRAIDSVGTNWGTPRRVDSTSYAQFCKLFILNNRPVIAYWDDWTNRIKIVIAADSVGTSWLPHTIPVNANVQMYFDATAVNGKPAIVYGIGSTLYYTIAQDSLGQTWNTPVVIAANWSYPSQSIAIIDGHPAIAFQEANSFNLSYRRAIDPDGDNWGPIITTSPTAYAGYYCNMHVHNNKPMIAYTYMQDHVRLVTALDSHGLVWNPDVLVDSLNGYTFELDINTVSTGSYVGFAYYNQEDSSAYYVRSCIPPLAPGISPPQPVCLGQTTVLDGQGYGTLSWYTSSNGGTYLGSGSTFTTPVLTNTTTFYVQDSTCAASTRTAVTVNVNPLPTISLSGNTQLCTGDSTTLTVSGNGDGFEWSTGSMNMSESFVPASTTNYWVMTYDGAGCVDTIFFSVNVTPPQTTAQTIPLCDGDSYSVGNNTYTVAGTYTDSLTTVQADCDSVVVTTITIQPSIDTTVNYTSGVLLSNESGATYQWMNCTTQQAVNGATNQNFTPTQNGTYAVVIVNGPCEDTSVCYTVTDVGVDEIVSNAAALVVTTTSGQITAMVQTGTGRITYEFYNTLGELVFTTSVQVGEAVNYQSQSTGMYVVKASGAGSTMVKRVLVQ